MSESVQDNKWETLQPLAVNAAGVGRLLCISRAKVFELHSRGRLPLPVRLGGRCPRWIVSELHEWLKAGAPHIEVWEKCKGSHGIKNASSIKSPH
jgi:predicted DNA-binding transcriptional regulator AlpA